MSFLQQTIIEHGLFVFPLHSLNTINQCSCDNPQCSSPGKHPFYRSNWKKAAISSEASPKSVQTLLNQVPSKFNLGLLTGRRSKLNNQYLIVIDVDKSSNEIDEFLQGLPKTFSYATGKGRHYWFWSKVSIPNSKGKILDGIDVRGRNGYVVAPPSKHVSGRSYKLDGQSHEIAQMPEFLVQLLLSSTKSTTIKQSKSSQKQQQPKPQQTKQSTWVVDSAQFISACLLRGYAGKLYVNNRQNVILNQRTPSQIPYGQRNVVMHRLLSWKRMQGATKNELLHWGKKYRNHCEHIKSFPMHELHRIVHSVLKYPAFNNRHENVHEQLKKSYLMRLWMENRVEKVHHKYEKAFDRFLDGHLVAVSKEDIRGKRLNVGIKQVHRAYKRHMRHYGFFRAPGMTYQMMARILENKGFRKIRRKQGNFWAVKLLSPSYHCRRLIAKKRQVLAARNQEQNQPKTHLSLSVACMSMSYMLSSSMNRPYWPSERLEYSTGPPGP